VVQAQFSYTTNNGTITITGYSGPGGAVNIPSTINGLPVTSIGYAAFSTSPLTGVTIPDSVANIGDYAFNYCLGLVNVTLGHSVTNIGGEAFYHCTSLANVADLDNVTGIGDWAFWFCAALTNLTIGDRLTSIGFGAFYDCFSLTSVTIPDSLTNTGDYVFCECFSLTNVTIGTNVTGIGSHAFFSCTSLTGVTIPDRVTSIGDSAFGNCTSLKAIRVDALNPSYSTLDGVLFDKSQTTIIQYPGGKAGPSYTTPSGVTSVEANAFAGCGLTNVTIGDSVTSIGESAFGQCTNLSSVTIGNSVTNIGSLAFAGCIRLAGAYFRGDAPIFDWYQVKIGRGVQLLSPFGCAYNWSGYYLCDYNATAYYLSGTTGWGPTFADLPTALWTPQVQINDASFGVRTNQFGFNINWANDMTVVVEASTSLANPTWSPLATNTLTGSPLYFSDPQWTNYPTRFYRLRWP
jgi:hypothetical protein